MEPLKNADETRLAELLTLVLDKPNDDRKGFLRALPETDSHLLPILQELIDMPLPELPTGETIEQAARQAAVEVLRQDPDVRKALHRVIQTMRETSGAFKRLRLEKTIGDTSRSTVKTAEDTCLQHWVAVKILKDSIQEHPSLVQTRFLREIDVLSRLRHPHILPLLDYGINPEGCLYYVTRWMQGGSLRDWLDGKPCTGPRLRELIAHLANVAEAAHAAHAMGVLHRDIKPGNILLDKDHQNAYLADWGIASPAQFQTPEPLGSKIEKVHERLSPLLQPGQTQYGSALGTLWYMAPEQARGESANCDHRADVYALGAVLYEALNGSAPHRRYLEGEDFDPQRVEQILGDPPQLDRPAGAPKELSLVALKALSARPKERYANASCFAGELRAWLENRPVAAMGNRPVYALRKAVRRRPGLTITALLVSLVGAGSLYFFNRTLTSKNKQISSESVTSDSAINFMANAFRATRPTDSPIQTKPQEILASALKSFDKLADASPIAKARLQLALGAVLSDLEDHVNAEAPIRKAYEVLHDNPDATPGLRLHSAHVFYTLLGKQQKQEEERLLLLKRAFEKNAHLLAPNDLVLLVARLELAFTAGQNGEEEKSILEIQNVIADLSKLPGLGGEAWPRAHSQLAVIKNTAGDRDGAMASMHFALSECDRIFGINHPYSAHAMAWLADRYRETDELTKARELTERRAAFSLEHYGEASMQYINAQHGLGQMLMKERRYDLAVPVQEAVIAGLANHYPPGSPPLLHTTSDLALSLARLKEFDRSTELFRTLQAGWEAQNDRNMVGALEMLLATAALEVERWPLAEEHARTALAILTETLSPTEDRAFGCQLMLSRVVREQGRTEEALQIILDSLPAYQAERGKSTTTIASLMRNLHAAITL